MKRIAIVTDAWHPQINGVVTTLSRTAQYLEKNGHHVKLITPASYRTFGCPTYPEIRLSIAGRKQVARELEDFSPDCIHIATEGPLGWAARAACLQRNFPFTTSYHTRFPEYAQMRFPVPLRFGYAFIRRFHRPSTRTMVSTQKLAGELQTRGFGETVQWSRGVDTDKFKPGPSDLPELPRPVCLYVGRIAPEKNIEAFLRLHLRGTAVIVGDGPSRVTLAKKYPNAVFTGYRSGGELISCLQAADVFVFPSLTDTFGLVMLEAMSCGVPVAAYPVTGPVDLIKNGVNGYVHEDLHFAIQKALGISSQLCRKEALKYSWKNCTEQFLGNLETAAVSFSRKQPQLTLQKA